MADLSLPISDGKEINENGKDTMGIFPTNLDIISVISVLHNFLFIDVTAF